MKRNLHWRISPPTTGNLRTSPLFRQILGVWLLSFVTHWAMAQVTVTGTVTGSGETLVGVTVKEKGTMNAAMTDANGKYALKVKDGASVLVFSFIGFEPKEETVGNRKEISVSLAEGANSLEEIVVIGYGQAKKSDLTGSISTVNAETIQRANKTNPFQAMQGQVAGVNLQTTDNKPGGAFTVRIRGANTINSNQSTVEGGYVAGQNPLFVVDGIFVNDIQFLNPADIAQMDILKDASATAIYGSRGTNGVVIIKTKGGTKGKVSVSYDNYFGTKQAYNIPNMLQGEEFVEYFKQVLVGNQYATGNYNFTKDNIVLSNFMRPNEIANINSGTYTDWIKLSTVQGFQTNHTVGLSGGSENTTFGLGMAYTKDEGTFEGEGFERFNLRGNIVSKILPKLTLGYTNYISLATRNEGSREGLRNAYRLRPTGTPFDANGNRIFFPIEGETFITHPLFEIDNMLMETRTLSYLGNISLEYAPLPNLRISTNFSPNIEYGRYGEYRGRFNKSTNGVFQNTRATVNLNNRISYTWDNIINHDWKINDKNSLNSTFVYSQFFDRSEFYGLERRSFSTDQFLFYNLGAGPVIQNASSGLVKSTLESYTGRLNFNHGGKYLVTFTGRYDGSSILAPGNKWAFFPSAAFAWRIAEEGFMRNQNTFSDLKMRLSYGQTGNNGAGGGLVPLGSQALIGNGFTNIGDQVLQTAFVNNLANQNLTWERTREWNLGLDFGFVNNRITGTLDLYHRLNSDIIFFRPVPTASGFSGVFENVGEAFNRGVELGINSVNVNKGGFKWTTNLNFATNQNRVTQLYNNLEQILFNVQAGSFIHKVGHPLGSLYTFEFDGIWQLDEIEQAAKFGQRPGQIRVKDIDGNGVINANDRTIIGNTMPKWTGGITNTFEYKNFDFSVFVFTSQGAKAASWFHLSHGGVGGNRFNTLKWDYWTPENPSNTIPQPGNPGPFEEPFFYRDVSYTRVGFMTLGYNFKPAVLEKVKLKGARIYFTGQNPFTFTSFEGWDPETAARNSWGSAHLSRTWMGGVNIKF